MYTILTVVPVRVAKVTKRLGKRAHRAVKVDIVCERDVKVQAVQSDAC